VDYDTLDDLVDFHLEQGTDGIVPCGTTGESPTLSHEEHEHVIERVVKRVARQVPVIAGTGSNSTSEALMLTEYAKKVGADGALMITPYYNKPEPEGMYQHFRTVAEAVDIPIVLYNVPSRTGRSIAIETVERLSHVKNIVAIKEASISIEFATEVLRRCDMTLLSGEDSMTLPLLAIGGKGVISVVANIAPQPMCDMIRAFNDGRAHDAMALHRRLYPLCKAMFVETNPIPVKAAMKIMGMVNGELRLPLTALTADKEPRLRAALREFGLCS
jgi:4-hydroxy-tetrahydrodipicolinate synthase